MAPEESRDSFDGTGPSMTQTVNHERDGPAEEAGPLISFHLSLPPNPLRIGPGWAVLAGALVTGVPILEGTVPLRLLGAVVLADAAWGALWRPGGTGSVADSKPALTLPYSQPHGPSERVMRWIGRSVPGSSWQALGGSVVAIAGLTFLLGAQAWFLSAAALLLAAWTWTSRQAQDRSAIPYVLLGLCLPWLLGSVAVDPKGSFARLPAEGLLLLVAFSVLQWGVLRVTFGRNHGSMAIWLGQIVVLAVLCKLRQPGSLALTAALFMPPVWWLAGASKLGTRAKAILAESAPWWWAALLLTAFAAR